MMVHVNERAIVTIGGGGLNLLLLLNISLKEPNKVALVFQNGIISVEQTCSEDHPVFTNK